MIPRYQKIVFFALLVVSIAMAAILVRLRERAHDRLLQGEDVAPTSAPAVAPAEQATLVVANDNDGTLTPEAVSLPLPKDEGARARALLEKLLELYASPGSNHPVAGTPRPVGQVFLLALPESDAHPSGIEVEALTVLSICGTLHANLPQITQVRFLVDGAGRKTLAGHADLSRTYLTGEAVAGVEVVRAP